MKWRRWCCALRWDLRAELSSKNLSKCFDFERGAVLEPPSSHHDNTDLAQLWPSSCCHLQGYKYFRTEIIVFHWLHLLFSFCPQYNNTILSLEERPEDYCQLWWCDVRVITTLSWVTSTDFCSVSIWQPLTLPSLKTNTWVRAVTLSQAREEMLLIRPAAAWSLGLIASLCEILKQSWEDVARDKLNTLLLLACSGPVVSDLWFLFPSLCSQEIVPSTENCLRLIFCREEMKLWAWNMQRRLTGDQVGRDARVHWWGWGHSTPVTLRLWICSDSWASLITTMKDVPSGFLAFSYKLCFSLVSLT